MNAYTTRGQGRIQPRDFSAVLGANQLAGAPLAVFERQRECQAEAETTWLLKQNGAKRKTRASRVALLRQIIGGALVRAGERLAGTPGSGVSLGSVPVTNSFGTAG